MNSLTFSAGTEKFLPSFYPSDNVAPEKAGARLTLALPSHSHGFDHHLDKIKVRYSIEGWTAKKLSRRRIVNVTVHPSVALDPRFLRAHVTNITKLNDHEYLVTVETTSNQDSFVKVVFKLETKEVRGMTNPFSIELTSGKGRRRGFLR